MTLPVEAVLPALRAALAEHPCAVLQAPPGAGKSTLVPLALLGESWLDGRRILMLEPRRLAARATASRMAQLRGEAVGGTVGYRIRNDSRVSAATRIEVVTEGILTRMIQDDPGLERIGIVIFDEFHERALASDLGLALCLDLQAGLRPDLRLLVMSATLEAARVAALLGDAPVIESEGRVFPVDVFWQPRPLPNALIAAVADTVRRALADKPDGDILVFLPGQGEIRRVAGALDSLSGQAVVLPLYGDLSQEQQDRALTPLACRRKVVLATAIAETSLTIPGVSIVIDAGLTRQARFDARSGMSRLVTLPVAKASAEQRRGRAGRLQPGRCYRLWNEAEHRALPAFAAPEIIDADLAPLALELVRWGSPDPALLAWLDPPPRAAFEQGLALLQTLGALTAERRLTPLGHEMAALPLHPRLARLLLAGGALGLGSLAASIAALLSERDILRPGRGTPPDSDLRRRVEAVLHGEDKDPDMDRGGLQRVRDLARQLRRQLGIDSGTSNSEATGLLLAFAFPDRVAQRRPGALSTSYRLANGRGAVFAAPEAISGSPWLCIADLDGGGSESRIYLAAPLSQAELEAHFSEAIETSDTVEWDKRAQAVLARRQTRFGALVLAERPIPDADPSAVIAAQLGAIKELGLGVLPWTAEARLLQQRVQFLRRHDSDSAQWPDLSDDALLQHLPDWLAPIMTGMSRAAHWAKIDLAAALASYLDWGHRQRLDQLAPTHIQVPSGSRIAIDYSDAAQPVLAVRLQEMFGLAETPALLGGRLPLLLHLLSPARRPVQVTRDLAGFWSDSYRAVKADLKGQYPKHVWPDDPLAATPTARAKPRPR